MCQQKELDKIPWRITLFFSILHPTMTSLSSFNLSPHSFGHVNSRSFASFAAMVTFFSRETIYSQNDVSKFLECQVLWIRQHPSPGLITNKSKDGWTLDSPGRSFTLPFPQYPKSGQRYLPWNHHYLSSWFSLCWFMLVTQEAQVSRSFLIPCITFNPKWSFTSCFLIQFHTLSIS